MAAEHTLMSAGVLALRGAFKVGDKTLGNLNGPGTDEPITVTKIVTRKAWERWLHAHLDAEGVRLALQRTAWETERRRPVTYAEVRLEVNLG